jgi:hypothetical protein
MTGRTETDPNVATAAKTDKDEALAYLRGGRHPASCLRSSPVWRHAGTPGEAKFITTEAR